jgi:flagellar protein FliO/FliZ
MSRPIASLLATGVALMTAPLFAAAEAAAKRFAAPDATTSLPANAVSSGGRVTLALVVVLAAVFVVAALMRRLRKATAAANGGLEVVSQVALGARERAVILQAGQQRLLLGVAPGRVSLLQVLPAAEADALQSSPPTATPAISFRSLLLKSLGRAP